MNSQSSTSVIEHALQTYENLDCVGEIFSAQIVWVSSRLASSLGYTQEELQNIHVRKFIDSLPTDFLKLFISQYTGEQVRVKLIRKDGNRVNAAGNLTSFTYQNEPFIAICNGIVEK